jgi:hypothetical protein
MLFTEKLKLETSESHKLVDDHHFVKSIKTSKLAGKLYVQLNQLCVYFIQEKYKTTNCDFLLIYIRMIRNIDINTIDLVLFNEITELTERCVEYPLEHSYMMYCGLLYGGSMLSKFLPEYKTFLTFMYPQKIIKDFKEYLDENIKDQDQDKFIQIVNDSYKLIEKIFDKFYLKL